MSKDAVIDDVWLSQHPLPEPDPATDKNSRGRVLVVGGAQFVPGALRLTGEAALRAGAGKLQMATVESVALALGVLVPEAAMIALPADSQGEIDIAAEELLNNAIGKCDALVLGSGMSESANTGALVRQLIANPREGLSLVLDAAAITVGKELIPEIAAHESRVVLTPHFGELASFTGATVEEIGEDPRKFAVSTATKLNAVVVLKSAVTVIASPGGECLSLSGDCVGLATSGSGDVLAGIIGGLLARGTKPLEAAAWGVWLHNAAGRSLTEEVGAGFLARQLVDRVPVVLHQATRATHPAE